MQLQYKYVCLHAERKNSKGNTVGYLTKSKVGVNQQEKRKNVLFLGSGPDRGQSPVEWGEILFVHLSIRLSPLAGA